LKEDIMPGKDDKRKDFFNGIRKDIPVKEPEKPKEEKK
jgi:hypothetical protein